MRFFSAPGEGREAVEIARWVLAEARAGTPFDDMAVLLRTPQTYSPLLETAFRRAGIPAYFAARHPAARPGRARLPGAARLRRRTALGGALRRVPVLRPGPGADRRRAAARPTGMGRPARRGARRRRRAGRRPAARRAGDALAGDAPPASAGDPAPEGALRAPWKWEALLVDAAVIGGAERWSRRLDGLAHELELQRSELARRRSRRARAWRPSTASSPTSVICGASPCR